MNTGVITRDEHVPPLGESHVRSLVTLLSCLLAANMTFNVYGQTSRPRGWSDIAPPLTFEEAPQGAMGTRYIAHGTHSTILFGDGGVTMLSNADVSRMELRLKGSNRQARLSPQTPLTTKVNYFRGTDERSWRTNVQVYGRLHYEDVYQGIDLDFYGYDGSLEYDFVVSPGADPRAIRWMVNDGTRISLGPNGDLSLSVGATVFNQKRPVAYQMIRGRRVDVASAFALVGPDQIGFAIGEYDHTTALTIDPVIAYSSYFGGAGDDDAGAIALRTLAGTGDNPISETHVFIAGSTTSTDLPQLSSVMYRNDAGENVPQAHSTRDVFVSKHIIRSNGDHVVAYTTYFGCAITACAATNDAKSIVALDDGSVVVAGTASQGFVQTPHSYGTSRTTQDRDCFAARLGADGSTLSFSTLVGGMGKDECAGVAVNSDGTVTLVGVTSKFSGAYDFPGLRDDSNNIKPTLSGAARNLQEAVIATIAADGRTLVRADYLGGNGDDVPRAIKIDSDGTTIVAGGTSSSDIPVSPGATTTGAGFLMRLSSSGTLQRFSRFATALSAIDIDSNHDLHATSDGGEIARLDATFGVIATLPLGTHIRGNAIVADTRGNSWVAMTTDSTFDRRQLLGAEQVEPSSAVVPGVGLASHDMIVLKVARPDATSTTLAVRYASYLGGQTDDTAAALAIDDAGYPYLVGTTSSADFPISHRALQKTFGGGRDVFVRKLLGDLDRDGIPDYWELTDEGIDLDRNGVAEVNLASLGATIDKKDLFVEIDYLDQVQSQTTTINNVPTTIPGHTHHPEQYPDTRAPLPTLPLTRLIDVFDNAPVPPPADCLTCQSGVRLHFRGGAQQNSPDEAIPETSANREVRYPATTGGIALDTIKWGSEHPVFADCQGYFGTAADRSNPATCQGIRNAWLQVTHYVLRGHSATRNNGGWGEETGNDVVLVEPLHTSPINYNSEAQAWSAYAAYGNDPGKVWSDWRAYNIMHELGHTLGLQHGGGTILHPLISGRINCKPNYLSIMNYSYVNPSEVHDNLGTRDANGDLRYFLPRRQLDYSRQELSRLNESALNEQAGVGGPANWDVIFSVRVSATDYPRFLAPADGGIDWSSGNAVVMNGGVPVPSFDPPGTVFNPTPDINVKTTQPDCAPSSSPQILEGANDWEHLIFDFRLYNNSFYSSAPDDGFYAHEPSELDLYLADGTRPRFNFFATTSCNTTVPATVALESSISDDDHNVARVEYFVDGTKVGESSAGPEYKLAWDLTQAGDHYFSATVTDERGWSISTEPRTVTFSVGSAPTMALTSPPEGATYAEGATILLSADIDDADDCIDSVYFYSGETNLGAAQLFRLRPRHWLAQMNWNGVPRGTHVVTARVRQGGVFASQQRQIVVNPNTPPVVTIIAPTNESYVRGPISVMVTADAYDSDGSLTKVEFIADAVKIGELTTPSSGGYTYSLTWPDAPIGTHELTVRATDAIGASTSVSVRLHVVSNLPPQITITSPSSGTQYRAPRWVTGAFTMSDPDGSIANTQFFINGQLDWELPYPQSTFYFKATEPGTYTFAVAGTDDEGQTTLSAPIQITITPPCPPPQFAGVATVVADQSSMNVSWLAAEGTCQEYPVFYNVYRSVDPSFEPTDDSWWDCRISDTTFVDTYGLVPGVTYYYIVRAIHSDSMGCFRSSEDENVVRLSGRIEPPPALVGFVLTPTIVVGGAHAQATVTLDKPAPGGGAEIALQSPSPAAVVPSSVNIPEGGTTATFDVVTAPVDSITTVELTATYGAPLAASITIRAPQITSLAVAPTSVLGGQPSNATITLDGPAPSGFVVSMSASSAAVGVASAVTVPPDESEASVPLTTSTVAADNNVVITARRDGIERTATLTVHSETAPAPAITNLSLTPTNGVPGIANIAGTVTLSNAAPNPLDVTLQSSRTDLATVPASVHFTQGMTSASFPLTPIHGVAEATMVSVTATLSNTLSATVRLDPPIAESIEIAAEVPSGEQVPFVVHVTGFVVPNGSLVLTSSDPSVASPSTASENGTAYSGVLNTGIVNSATSIVLSVTSGGVTISKTITVSPCTLDPVSPSVPQGDTVWIEDSLPEWAFVDEGDPGTWDTSQHATGDASLKIGLSEWWRDSFVYFDSSNVEPPELGADQTFVSYVLINQCETAPRTLSIAIEKPVSQPCCGRRRPDSVYVLYWGDDVPLEEEGFVGTVATIRVGDVPPAGQWTRLELPLAMIYSGPVSWLDFRAYGGEVWWDHIGVSDVAAQARIGEAVLPESPQPAGVTLSWEIRALGGLPPIEYQFERLDGSTWTVVQPYGTSNIYMWTPGATDVGQHSIRASVRNSGSVAAFEDRRSYSFVVSSPP